MPKGRFATYAEPFVGGGALFFALAARGRFDRALLSDKNPDLVALYRAIQTCPAELIASTHRFAAGRDRMSVEAQREQYYAVRAMIPEALSDIERAARLLYLNKTCFNGLWRVNSKGEFNVPFGDNYRATIVDESRIYEAHKALLKADVACGDYTEITRELREGDFAYFDPPYAPVSKTAKFTSYAVDGFGPAEQERLKLELEALRDRGVRALLSNADTPAMRELYASKNLYVATVSAARSINSDGGKRGEVSELVVTNYPRSRSRPRAQKAVSDADGQRQLSLEELECATT